MYQKSVETVQKYFEDDVLCKKDIGMKIKDFRCGNLFLNRDTLSRKMEYSFCTIANVETGKYYPKLEMVTRLVNVSKMPLYFVLQQPCRIRVDYNDLRAFEKCTENQRVRILMRLLCEKCGQLQLYDEKIMDDICHTKPHINPDNLGYLLMFERKRRGIGRSKLAKWLGVEEKKIGDMEKGNASVPFKKIYFISCLFEVPVDFFIMECLQSKQYIVNYLLTEVFLDADEKSHEFYRRYIETFRYKYEKNI